MEHLPKDYWVTSAQFTPKTYQTVYPAIDPTNPKNSLAGKVAIIVGASQGIGAKGIVPSFARASPKGLVLVATGADKLKEIEDEVHKINPEVQTLAVPTNISDAAAVAELFRKVRDKFGHADILVNNAAVNSGGGAIHEEDPEQWWSNFEVNVKGAFLISKGFISQLPSPSSTPAAIATLTTFASYQVFPFMSGYGTSKLAAQQLNASVAAAYPNVTAVNVHPGLVDTRLLLDVFRHFNLDDPTLVGGTLVWLTVDPQRSKFLSGRMVSANWDVDGLLERKDEIQKDNLLVLDLKGKFGKEQFE